MSSPGGALLATLRLLAEHVEGAWWRGNDEAQLFVSGLPEATLNPVIAGGEDPPVAAVEELLDAVAQTGLPYSLITRPGGLPGLPERRGMVAGQSTPLMRLDRLEPAAVPDLAVRRLGPEDAALGVRLQAAGFGAPETMFAPLTTPRMLAVNGVRLYVGEVAGEPVTTAMSFAIGDAVGLFNVATLPAHRRRGYGAAITARVVADGLTAGAAWAWLEATPAALPVYERLGFRSVVTRAVWVAQNTLASSQSAAK